MWSFSNCNSGQNRVAEHDQINYDITGRYPKVLYITTGANRDGDDIDLPHGIIIALHTFNKRGITVRLEPRDVLFDKEFLFRYNIIILSTALGYHDADRQYSLTYMSDAEMKNLDEFVAKGGILIAGDNVGRNYFDGNDRLEDAGLLNKNNYPLSKTFGITQREKNLKGYKISGYITDSLKGDFTPVFKEDLWMLVPDTIISKTLKVLAYWKSKDDSIPAIIQNDYGDGTAYLLATSDFLDAGEDSQFWNIVQLQRFYDYVAGRYLKKNNIDISLNPWPDGHQYAFSITFNAQGQKEHYQRVISKLKKRNIKPVFFVNGQVNDTVRNLLKEQKVNLASTGYHYANYDQYDYPAAVNDVLQNHYYWDKKFKGFRFPYTNPVFSGLLALDMHGYEYESSISINNLEFIHGSVFPYNIIITHDKFYKSTDVYEIGPSYHDDYYFLKHLKERNKPGKNITDKNVLLYKQYLLDFWKYSIKPYNGAMIFIGHPDLTGYNDNTFSALLNLVDTVKNDNAWVTTIDEIASFRKRFEKLNFYMENHGKNTKIIIQSQDKEPVKSMSIFLTGKPANISAKKGDVRIKEKENGFFIIFDAFDGQEIDLYYK